ncbi:SDR family oxidoreductase [Ferruginibacter lapsinanis]|uniref:SDR family NAD(P)-dependent oxidoreductase n=1 Tax=Ferruginibacter lapsinanis TaxID=563172 RepID=UPI001E537F1E|nr:SDR family oxidoreductase [Ferruginibacter lapsinanis]UEG49553.1 SDR family oxidoreductase [Ferruginibacter lapsinanis]
MKNIVIVGAGKGIGLKVAELLNIDNHLITISRNATLELDSLHTKFYQLDVTNNDIDILNDLPDVINGLVYCPGSINLKPFNRLTTADFLNDFNQNVLGAVTIIQKLLPNLKRANNASVVLFSTVAVKVGMPFHASIAAAKGAIEGLAKSLAAEFATTKIRVNVIAPSLTDTPLASVLLNTEEKREASAKRHPLQRIGTPEEIAKLVCFLMNDDSSWITGQVIGVDGGLGSLKI